LIHPLLGGFFGYGRHGAAVGHFIPTTAVAADHHKIFLHTPDGGCGVVAGNDDPGAGQVAAVGVFGVAGYGIGAVGAGITQLCRAGGNIGIVWRAGLYRSTAIGTVIKFPGVGDDRVIGVLSVAPFTRIIVIGVSRTGIGARCLGVIRSRRQ